MNVVQGVVNSYKLQTCASIIISDFGMTCTKKYV
jgi:hypothetical protein